MSDGDDWWCKGWHWRHSLTFLSFYFKFSREYSTYLNVRQILQIFCKIISPKRLSMNVGVSILNKFPAEMLMGRRALQNLWSYLVWADGFVLRISRTAFELWWTRTAMLRQNTNPVKARETSIPSIQRVTRSWWKLMRT